jgi:hypothetical protein
MRPVVSENWIACPVSGRNVDSGRNFFRPNGRVYEELLTQVVDQPPVHARAVGQQSRRLGVWSLHHLHLRSQRAGSFWRGTGACSKQWPRLSSGTLRLPQCRGYRECPAMPSRVARYRALGRRYSTMPAHRNSHRRSRPIGSAAASMINVNAHLLMPRYPRRVSRRSSRSNPVESPRRLSKILRATSSRAPTSGSRSA